LDSSCPIFGGGNTFLHIAWSIIIYGTYIEMEKSWHFWVPLLILGQKFPKISRDHTYQEIKSN
jgi:hypothetical protein